MRTIDPRAGVGVSPRTAIILKTAELLVVSLILGGAVGLAAAALPARVRVLGLMAVGLGFVTALGVRWLADGVGVRRPAIRAAAAAFAALVVVGVYGGRSSQKFADVESARNGREKMVEILLDQLPDDVRRDFPVDPLPRWLRWRTKSLQLTGPWPAVFAGAEAVACVLSAAVLVWWLPS